MQIVSLLANKKYGTPSLLSTPRLSSSNDLAMHILDMPRIEVSRPGQVDGAYTFYRLGRVIGIRTMILRCLAILHVHEAPEHPSIHQVWSSSPSLTSLLVALGSRL